VLLLACLALPALAADPATDAAKPPINLDIGTPPVVVVKHALAQRTSRLVRFYEAGEIGLGKDGFIYLRDGVKILAGQAPDRRKADRRGKPGTQAR
jgi:hypothetical protein